MNTPSKFAAVEDEGIPESHVDSEIFVVFDPSGQEQSTTSPDRHTASFRSNSDQDRMLNQLYIYSYLVFKGVMTTEGINHQLRSLHP